MERGDRLGKRMGKGVKERMKKAGRHPLFFVKAPALEQGTGAVLRSLTSLIPEAGWQNRAPSEHSNGS